MNRAKAISLAIIGVIVYGIKTIPLFGASPIAITIASYAVFALLAVLLMQIGNLNASQSSVPSTQSPNEYNLHSV